MKQMINRIHQNVKKLWGDTEALHISPCAEVHRIRFQPGKECSEHFHAAKVNAFYVIRGRMAIIEYVGETSTRYDIGPGVLYTVPAGRWHKFVGLTEGEALEIYWPDMTATDIHRRTTGGDSPIGD